MRQSCIDKTIHSVKNVDSFSKQDGMDDKREKGSHFDRLEKMTH